MKTIKHERLIELAEGREEPTAEESRLLKTSESLRAEFEELTTLFTDLRAQPEPELDPRAIAGILPAVRAGIAERAARNPFARLFDGGLLNNFVAAAASLLILFGLLYLAPESFAPATDQELLSYGFASAQLADPAFDVGVLQLEAGESSEFELYGDIDNVLDSTDSIELLDDNTFDLMDRAAELDDSTFKEIKESFAAIL